MALPQSKQQITSSYPSSLADEDSQLHFVLFPFMAQGHMIPMVDTARMLAHRGLVITIITTPGNAARFKSVLTRTKESGHKIRLIQLEFPSEGTGLPHGCENLDMVPSLNLASNFFDATKGLQEPVEKLFQELSPKPSCIISDMCLPWTINISRKFNIPRISFSGTCCFTLLCFTRMHTSKVADDVTSETEYFVLPDLPDRIEATKAQMPEIMAPNMEEFYEQMNLAEMGSYGTIMNSFEELEPAYVEEYKKVKQNRVWCVGPASLCNKDDLDKAQRGNKASVDGHYCLNWLDSWEPSSVLYVCFGSLCNLIPAQLIELGLGLEASNKPFIWAMRGCSQTEALEKWITENGFEERTEGRSLLIRGWAPQTLILSHPAVGGFLTHCGWNSTLEGICAGVPMTTWPLFGDQFLDEKLVEQILKVAVRVGVEYPTKWGEEEKIGVLVKKENVKEAIKKLMDGEESEARRGRARELAKLAKRAVEDGGSSHLNIGLLIQDILQQGIPRETN